MLTNITRCKHVVDINTDIPLKRMQQMPYYRANRIALIKEIDYTVHTNGSYGLTKIMRHLHIILQVCQQLTNYCYMKLHDLKLVY